MQIVNIRVCDMLDCGIQNQALILQNGVEKQNKLKFLAILQERLVTNYGDEEDEVSGEPFIDKPQPYVLSLAFV